LIALSGEIGTALSVFFILGLTAAAYSSADSALTALTTSVSVDFMGIDKRNETEQVRLRKRVHIGVSALMVITILILHYTLDLSAIDQVIYLAGFTYGPLIGLFLFGLLTKRSVPEWVIVGAALVAPLATWLITDNSMQFIGFSFGALHIVLNAAITALFLFLASKPQTA
jgi:Na+/proline symporter